MVAVGMADTAHTNFTLSTDILLAKLAAVCEDSARYGPTTLERDRHTNILELTKLLPSKSVQVRCHKNSSSEACCSWPPCLKLCPSSDTWENVVYDPEDSRGAVQALWPGIPWIPMFEEEIKNPAEVFVQNRKWDHGALRRAFKGHGKPWMLRTLPLLLERHDKWKGPRSNEHHSETINFVNIASTSKEKWCLWNASHTVHGVGG